MSKTRLSKKVALECFKEHVYPAVIEQYGKNDKVAMATAWNDYTDMLCKDGEISEYQYNTWTNPF